MKENKSIAVGVILHTNLQQVFIALRDSKAEQGALWEFPGGKVELGESSKQAVIRELKEEVGITATHFEHFISLTHEYEDKVLNFDFYLIHQYEGVAHGREQQLTKWVHINELANYAFPEANLPVLEAIQEYFAITLA